jgi:hypothetical protein
MNKKQILEMTGLSESDFYKQYPTQEAFIKKYKSGGVINANQLINMPKSAMYGKGGPIWAGLNADKNKNYGADIGIPLARSKKPNSQDLYMTGGVDFVNGNPEGNVGLELSNQYAKGHLRRSRGFRFDGSIGGGISTGNNETTPYVKGEAKVGYQYIGKGNKNKNLFPYLHAQHESKIPVGKYSNVGTKKDVNDYSKFGVGIEGDMKGGIRPYANFGYSLGDNTPYLQAGVRKTFGKGGFVDGLRNVGAILGDNALSVVGASNVADNNNWYSDSKFGKTTQDISKVTNKIQAIAGQVAATAIGGPMAGAAMGALQQGVGSVDKPKSTYQPNKWDEAANVVGQVGSTAAGFMSAPSGAASTGVTPLPDSAMPAMIAENGGMIPKGNIPEGKTLINVEKNELEVNPDSLEIVKHFKNKPNHPAYGIDEQGNTLATVGNVIIPKNMSDRYKKSDTYQQKAMINNLKYKQALREGGVYQYGGMIKKYAEGSVVTGPRADAGFYNFNNPITPPSTPNNVYGNFPRADAPDMNTIPSIQTSTRLANRLANPISKWNTNTINKPLDYSYNVAGRQELDRDGNRVSVNPMAPTNYQAPGSEFKQPMSMDRYGDAASKIGIYAPAAYNLIRGFDKAYSMDSSKYMTSDIQAPQMTGDAGRRDMLTAYNTGKYNINQLNTSGTLAALNNLNAGYIRGLGNYNEDLENRNKMLNFEASRSNQENQRNNNQLRMGLDQFNEQNREARQGLKATALTQGSEILQNERNNKMIAEAIRQSGQYGYFDKNGKYIVKGSKEDKS